MKLLNLSLSVVFMMVSLSLAQLNDESEDQANNHVGFVFTMAETGSGLGGFIAWPLFGGFHIGFNLDAYFLRDANQLDFDYYGMPVSINKKNNVYLFDAMITLKKRLFADDLDDSFQPFITGGVGPYFGMNFPEYDVTPEGSPTFDQYAWTVGGFAGAGVDVNVNEKVFIGIRAQYRVIPFPDVIGERSDHSMFELRFEIARRF